MALADGRQVQRKRWTQEDAETALEELKTKYAGELGYYYRWPRPFRPGTRDLPRRSMSRHLRFTILERDGFRCHYCGAPAPEVRLTVDHVVSIIDGGGDEPDNLVAACEDCNFGKGGRSLDLSR